MRSKMMKPRLAVAVITVAMAGGCGGGADSNDAAATAPAPAPAPTTKTLTLQSYGVAASQPGKVLSNDIGDRIEYWSTSTPAGVLAPKQARLTVKASGDAYRILYDSAGVPERILNEKTGEFVTQTFADNALYVLAYRADGTFVGGYKIAQADSRTTVAPIQGRAFFSGQLALDLNGGAQPASAALIPASEMITGAAIELPAKVQTFLNGGTPVTLRLRPMDRLFESLVGTAYAQQTGGEQVASGIAQGALGGLLAVAGAYAPVIATTVVGASTAAVAGPLLAVGLYAAAGWNVLNGVNDIISGSIKLVSDTTNRFADGTSPMDALNQQAGLILSNGLLATALRTLNQVLGNASDALSSIMPTAGLASPAPLPLASSTPVSGAAVDATGASVPLSGTVGSNGALSARSSGAANPLSIDGTLNVQGQANATFGGYLGSGQASGSTSPLGQCQQVTISGGRGTFVRAHNLGVTNGASVFSYDAYSIPDQFTVSTGGGAVFGTGRLVSGSGQANIPLSGSGIVFVAVNAPNSGTQWEYQLSCP